VGKFYTQPTAGGISGAGDYFFRVDWTFYNILGWLL
jgi:hypothetical protein